MISIHASAREATGTVINVGITFPEFQSTLPRGKRLYITLQIITCHSGFQSTLPRGKRLYITLQIITCHSGFQSTLPRGKRLVNKYICMNFSDFNPRFREGSDRTILLFDVYFPLFQSTLPRGKRLFITTDKEMFLYFNPRFREGSDSNNC